LNDFLNEESIGADGLSIVVLNEVAKRLGYGNRAGS
jgi:hypothetical protein